MCLPEITVAEPFLRRLCLLGHKFLLRDIAYDHFVRGPMGGMFCPARGRYVRTGYLMLV